MNPNNIEVPREKYIDEWDDTWVRISQHYVRRERDGNIGGWFDGKGLIESAKELLKNK